MYVAIDEVIFLLLLCRFFVQTLRKHVYASTYRFHLVRSTKECRSVSTFLELKGEEVHNFEICL